MTMQVAPKVKVEFMQSIAGYGDPTDAQLERKYDQIKYLLTQNRNEPWINAPGVTSLPCSGFSTAPPSWFEDCVFPEHIVRATHIYKKVCGHFPDHCVRPLWGECVAVMAAMAANLPAGATPEGNEQAREVRRWLREFPIRGTADYLFGWVLNQIA